MAAEVKQDGGDVVVTVDGQTKRFAMPVEPGGTMKAFDPAAFIALIQQLLALSPTLVKFVMDIIAAFTKKA